MDSGQTQWEEKKNTTPDEEWAALKSTHGIETFKQEMCSKME